MAFGAELKDFVAGFKTGRDIVEDGLDREERKEDRAYNRKHTADREAITDSRYDADIAHRDKRELIGDSRYDSETAHRSFREGVTDEGAAADRALRERAAKNQEDLMKLQRAKESGGALGPDGMGDYLQKKYPGGATPSSAGGDQSAIPENPFIQYANSGATRNQPLSPELTKSLAFLGDMGVEARVFSGGQDAEGPNRTGSHRHDGGGAGDVLFFKDGKKLDWNNPRDLPIFEEIVKRGKAAGLTGFGAGPGYMQSGSMHLGFGDPAVWGRGGNSENAPSWLRNAYYGNKRAGASRGGMMDPEELMEGAIPDDEGVEVASLDPRAGHYQEDAPRQQAIPDEESGLPAPAYEGTGTEVADASDPKEKPTKDPYELGRRSVRDGLKSAAKSLGIDREGAIDDPDMERARQNYLKGYGSATPQMMRQVMDTIDPKREMDPGERSLKAMGEVYQFYMSKGETGKAQEAAQSMLQFYRTEFNKYTALAQTAAQNGDMDNAAKAAVAAYSSIPNGRNFKVEKKDGGYEVSVTDAKTGKDVTRKVMDPREIAAAAMNFNPGTFDDEILNAAGVPPEEFKGQTTEALANVEGATGPATETLLEKRGDTDEARAATVRSIASSIAGVQENAMGPQEAAEFADKLAVTPSKDIAIKPVRGNPKLSSVTLGGQTVVMRTNAVAGLKGMQSAKAEADAEAAKPKEPSKAMENVGKFFDMMGGAIGKEVNDNLLGNKPEPAPQQGPQQPVPAEQAVPETGATATSDPRQIVETLLSRRAELQKRAANDPRAADMVRMIETRLKQLGYTGQ